MEMNYMTTGDRVVNQIYETYDYDKFIGTRDNRIDIYEEPNTRDYRELKDSIARYGGNISPIIVRIEKNIFNNKNYYVIVEGHHRYVACKNLGLPLRYMICNDMNLDMAIEMSDNTKKYTLVDLYERGLKHNVPLCLLVDEILKSNDVFAKDKAIRLVWVFMKSFKKYPCIDIIKSKLKTEEGIEELKGIEIEAKDVEKLKLFIARYLEIIRISESTKDVRANIVGEKFTTLSITSESICGFVGVYDVLDRNYDSWLKSWKKVCKCKTGIDRDIYNKITRGKARLVKQGIIGVLGR